MTCDPSSEYLSKNRRCCKLCAAGQRLINDCSDSKETECATCQHDYYTETKNRLAECIVCMKCSENNYQETMNACTATKNTVCNCVSGYYCSNDACEHCQPVTYCHPGEGVKVKATRLNDTVCVPCEDATFSNVTDFQSPCKAHTRCEDYGGVQKTLGTQTTDTICGNFQSNVPWMLPAGLWSGLVLTIIVVLLLILWRAKYKFYRAVCSSPPAVVEVVPALPLTPPKLLTHCQESCQALDCKLSIYSPDDTAVGCTMQDSSDVSLPRTLKTTVSFVETNHVNGNARHCGNNLLRSHSEPQEDEWCGT